jgi:predicted KAP-like P-loop ATPase
MLNSDKPTTDVALDLYGHAQFARTLASGISGYRGVEGLVVALHGPWGSGKSTILAYVEQFLSQGGDDEARPLVVRFNPWWFSGSDHLASAFFAHLHAALPSKYERFKKVGDAIASYADALGKAGDAIGTAAAVPLVGDAVRWIAGLLGRKPTDVPAAKAVLSELLRTEQKRIVVVIDDIDRLTPDEIRQLFTVVKALGDFPFITYLLAFDREVASQAITAQTGLPGDRYLEKIIQVSFEVPLAERLVLHRALSARLESLIAQDPNGKPDPAYWANIFHSGLAPLFRVPRDVVRLTNALSVTYPAVSGEVNPVDFIAVECLRIFLPAVYDAVRATPEAFVGYRGPQDARERESEARFHDAWLSTVPEPLRESTKDVMQRLFPRLAAVWSNMHYSPDSAREWRIARRVCLKDFFNVYFRLALAPGAVSRTDIDGLIAAARHEQEFAAVLLKARDSIDTAGVSKVRYLLDRFMDYARGLNATNAEPVIRAVFTVGDDLLRDGDTNPGSFDFGNESRAARIVIRMLLLLDAPSRFPLLLAAVRQAAAIRCSQYTIALLEDELKEGGSEPTVTADEIQVLKDAWLERVALAANAPNFIDHPDIGAILSGWERWGGRDAALAWWADAALTEHGLPKLIAAFAGTSTTQTLGDYAVQTEISVDAKVIARFCDVDECATKLAELLDTGQVPAPYVEAGNKFLGSHLRFKASQTAGATNVVVQD